MSEPRYVVGAMAGYDTGSRYPTLRATVYDRAYCHRALVTYTHRSQVANAEAMATLLNRRHALWLEGVPLKPLAAEAWVSPRKAAWNPAGSTWIK